MKEMRSRRRGVRTLIGVTAALTGLFLIPSNTGAVPFSINTDASSPNFHQPSVGSNGATFLVTQESEVSVVIFRGRHVTSTGGGQVADVFNFVEPANETRQHAATAGTSVNGNFLTVWNRLGHFHTQRSTASAATAGVIDFPAVIDDANCDSDLAFGTASYLIVYRRGNSIYGDRVNPATNSRLGEKLIAADPNAAAGDYYEEPAVAFNGTNNEYLVVWSYNYGYGYSEIIYARRVELDGDPTGSVIDISQVWNSSSYPDIAFASAENYYLVAWIEVLAADNLNVRGKKVNASGNPEGSNIIIESQGNCAVGPTSGKPRVSVAYGGGKFHVCWQQDEGGSDTPIYCREMNATTEAWETKRRCNSATSSGYVPVVAYASVSKADEFLVVWAEAGEIWGDFDCCGEESPVELAGFDACSRQGYVFLEWRTEAEIDNDKWVIQKRCEGESEWKELTRVPAKAAGPNTYTHRDADVRPGGDYWYQLGDIDTNGKLTWRAEVKVKYTGKASPSRLKLTATPTISVGAFRLKYHVPGSAIGEQQMPVSLKVYDAGGRLAHTLLEGTKNAGSYSATWNPEEPPGIYFCELRVGSERAVKKLIWCEDSRPCNCD